MRIILGPCPFKTSPLFYWTYLQYMNNLSFAYVSLQPPPYSTDHSYCTWIILCIWSFTSSLFFYCALLTAIWLDSHTWLWRSDCYSSFLRTLKNHPIEKVNLPPLCIPPSHPHLSHSHAKHLQSHSHSLSFSLTTIFIHSHPHSPQFSFTLILTLYHNSHSPSISLTIILICSHSRS